MIVYLSHSLGTGNGDESIRRFDNISNALNWYRWLTENTRWVIVIPWLPAVIAGFPEVLRPLTFANQLRALVKCEAMAMVGGVISPHMAHHEIPKCKRHRIPFVDYSDLGYAPPEPTVEILDIVRMRMAEAIEHVTMSTTDELPLPPPFMPPKKPPT